jgi:hypothetical protein
MILRKYQLTGVKLMETTKFAFSHTMLYNIPLVMRPGGLGQLIGVCRKAAKTIA